MKVSLSEVILSSDQTNDDLKNAHEMDNSSNYKSSLAVMARKNAVSPEILREMVNLYRSKQPRDVRYLTPVLSFLSYSQIVEYLPQIVALKEDHIKDAIYRISRSQNISMPQLLVELNSMVKTDSPQHEITNAINGIKVCFGERQIFNVDVMARALHKLTELFEDPPEDKYSRDHRENRRKPREIVPPTLSMRTFIQAIISYKKLIPLIIALLQRILNTGKITNPKYTWLFEGFIKCCSRLRSLKSHNLDLVQLIITLDYDHFVKILEEKSMKNFKLIILKTIDHVQHTLLKASLAPKKYEYLLKYQKKLENERKILNPNLEESPIEEKRVRIDDLDPGFDPLMC